ncbi:MAG TPA: hypothetical protein PK894_01790 [Defluviitoga sp.]|nr:hypothetical protein [Defluviitoga sp.]HOP23997.1 hypothetical protein [Defluviitoga sp.]HPZ28980.1 hypothetical protein [Defluviitoga sp.]HQD62318.1 hypothetical protein [Defluviitoga sp.]
MHQPIINLLVEKSDQSILFPSPYKGNEPDRVKTSIGEIIFIKNNLAVINYKNSLLFLEHHGEQIIKIGTKVKLNFTNNFNSPKTNVQMKLLGQFLNNEIKLNLKILQLSNRDTLKIYNENITDTQKLRIIKWLNDFIHEFEKNTDDILYNKINKEDLNSSGLFVKKVLEKLINSIYSSTFSFPSPVETSNKLANYIKYFLFKQEDVFFMSSNELEGMKKEIQQTLDEEIIRKKIDLNKEITSFEKDRRFKNIDSYLTIKNLVIQEQTPLIFTIILNLPIFMQIESRYNKKYNKTNNDKNYELSIILLTNKFGVVDCHIKIINDKNFVSFEVERNRDYFLNKLPELKDLLSIKEIEVEYIKVF